MLGFRVWDKDLEKMICEEDFYLQIDCLGRAIHGHYAPHEIAGDDIVPMQSTGHIDIKGNTIYEGDIFLIDYHRDISPFYVDTASSFIFQMGAMLVNDAKKDWEVMKYINCLPIEIIGNIYQNPELLEKLK